MNMNRDSNAPKPESPEPALRLQCAEIENVLFDYMSHEMGEARALLVREHLRHCPGCRVTAAGMQETVEALRKASREIPQEAEHLSDERRSRVKWALLHPVLEWMVHHHAVVSILIAVAVLLGLVYSLRRAGERKPEDLTGIAITIGQGYVDGHEGGTQPEKSP
jgi:predicted anti-sigma-YlaC factor YlaD